MTKAKRFEFSRETSSVLNSVSHLIDVHYSHMKRKEQKVKGLSEIRFGSMIFLFRAAGIPLKLKKLSKIYAAYMITVIICSFSAFIGMFIDAYIQREDLGRAMTSVRVLGPVLNVIWTFSYCR